MKYFSLFAKRKVIPRIFSKNENNFIAWLLTKIESK